MRKYLSNTLVHWTGRGKNDSSAMKSLSTICNEEILRLTFCPNYVSQSYNPETAMVCFTDIPLWNAKEHCKKFGKFGIGFKRNKMIEYGANPALYTTEKHFKRILHLSSLLSKMIDLEKDREWKQEEEPYFFNEDETVAFQEMLEFLQEYSYENQDQLDYVTYYQREWRIAFKSLPFAGGNTVQQPGMSCFYIVDGKSYSNFKFKKTDINFIVLPFKYWREGRKLSKKLNCKLKIYEFSVFM